MENLGRGGGKAAGGSQLDSTMALSAFEEGTKFRCGSGALLSAGSDEDNGSWALTSDHRLPPHHPITSSPALGWQEELELYCHPGRNWRTNQETPFRCMDEAVSLFSGGVFNGLELNTRETGQDSLCHSDKM